MTVYTHLLKHFFMSLNMETLTKFQKIGKEVKQIYYKNAENADIFYFQLRGCVRQNINTFRLTNNMKNKFLFLLYFE